MSLVDSTSVNAPESATSATSNEYTVRAYKITFQACKAGASHGVQAPTGNVYIMRKGAAGAGNRDDQGSMVAVIPTNALLPSFVLEGAPLNRNVFDPYQFYIDADNANDGAIVTLEIM